MSVINNYQVNLEMHKRIAKEILEKIGAIKCCEYHEWYLDLEAYDDEQLYALATYEYKKEGGYDFEIFHEAIAQVMDEAWLDDECLYCAKAYNE